MRRRKGEEILWVLINLREIMSHRYVGLHSHNSQQIRQTGRQRATCLMQSFKRAEAG